MTTALAYLLICLASVLFGCQFVFQQKYSKNEGTSVTGAFRFAFFVAAMQIIVVFLLPGNINGLGIKTAAIAALSSVNTILNSYFAVKVFEKADMTLFSIFEMLGGMALPFAAGLLFFREDATVFKFLGFALITAALILETGKASKITKQALFYYLGLFATNGMSGVYAKINQSFEDGASANGFMLMSAVWTVIFCGLALLFTKFIKKQGVSFANTKSAFLAIVPYVVIATLGNFLLLTALETLPASVQYPMSTGGTIVVSAVISLIQKEKLKPRNCIAVCVAVISAIVIAL